MGQNTEPVVVQFDPEPQPRERFGREANELLRGAVEGYSDTTMFLGRLLALRSQGHAVPVCAIAGDHGLSLAYLVTAIRERHPDTRVVVHASEHMQVRDIETLEGALHHDLAWVDVIVGRASRNPTNTTRALVRVCSELAAIAPRPHTKPYRLWRRRTDAQYPNGYPDPLAQVNHDVIAELTDEQVAGIDPQLWSCQCLVPETPDLRHPSPRIIHPPNEDIAALVTGGPRIAYVTTKGLTKEWADWMSDRGIQVHGRCERETYVIRTTPALLEELRDQPWCYAVHRVYPFRKAQHLVDAFLRQAYVMPHQGEPPRAQAWKMRLVASEGADLQATTAAILAIGGQRFAEGDMGNDCLGFTLDPYQLHAALLRDDITYAEKFAYAVPSAQAGT